MKKILVVLAVIGFWIALPEARTGCGVVLRPERCEAGEAIVISSSGTGTWSRSFALAGGYAEGRMIASSLCVGPVATCARCGRDLAKIGHNTDQMTLYRADGSRFFDGCMKCLEDEVALAAWTRKPDDSGRLVNGIDRGVSVHEELRSMNWYRDRWSLAWIDSSSRAHQILHEGNR